MAVTPMPGDVWAVRTNGFLAWLVRFGAFVRYLFGGNPVADLNNHVVIVIRYTDGVWWGIEGRPGGVGWADLTKYIDNPATVTNFDQPKTDAQRAAIIALVPQLLGVKYDWSAIYRSLVTDLHLDSLFRWRRGRKNSIPGDDSWGDGPPGQVICSSTADWMYTYVKLASPKGSRYVQPSDWTFFNRFRGWESVPVAA